MRIRDLGSLSSHQERTGSVLGVVLALLIVFIPVAPGATAETSFVESPQSSEAFDLQAGMSTPEAPLAPSRTDPFDTYLSVNSARPPVNDLGADRVGFNEVAFDDLMGDAVSASVLTGLSALAGTISLTGAQGYEGEGLTFVLRIDGSFGGTINGLILTAGSGEDFGGEATATRDIDYFHTRRTVHFSEPTVLDIYVPTYHDGVVEPAEWFNVIFFCDNCEPYIRLTVKGWILDDSAVASSLSVGDATVTEGDVGTTIANFTVNLSPANASTVTVDYSTCGVGCDPSATATGGDDYEIAVDSLTFSPGQTSKTIPVTINGDTAVEPDEIFFMYLHDAIGASIADNQGRGTIVNDDGPPSNTAPVVSAGSDQAVTLPSDVALDGSVTDDGLPSGTLTSTWTKVSGPGMVTFGNAHAAATTAGFSTDGVYVLRLTADDGALTTSDDVRITVNPQPPPPDFFIDDDDSMFEADINWMAGVGITKGCNPPTNSRFCPEGFVTRGQMAAFLVRALDLADQLDDPFVDDDDSIFEADIERLAAAGITRGCNPPANDRFCPDAKVTRGQMAAFLVRALGYTDDGGGDLFVDDDGSIFERDIDRLATAGVTRGCNPPTNDRFCPHDYVTRGQMAAFLHRALG